MSRLIKVTRNKHMVYWTQLADVVVDGQVIGHLQNGESRTFEISDSSHEIFVKLVYLGVPLVTNTLQIPADYRNHAYESIIKKGFIKSSISLLESAEKVTG